MKPEFNKPLFVIGCAFNFAALCILTWFFYSKAESIAFPFSLLWIVLVAGWISFAINIKGGIKMWGTERES